VHPLPFPPRFDDASASEISQVPGNLRLRAAQDFHEVTNAYLLVIHKVQEPEPSVVPESLKEPFHIEGLLRCHNIYVYALTYAKARHIVA
jgi:hypothetical protein